jgi:cell wall-associated NlpC family hydrolase
VPTPSVRKIVRRHVAATAVAVCAAGLVVGVTASAGATSKPTLNQVEAKLSKLQTQQDQLDQQYDQVQQQLQTTDQQLVLVDSNLARFSARFGSMRQSIARIAVTAYEDGNLDTSVTLLTSGNPQQILDQSSILLELSDTDNAQISQFLAAARQLTSAQEIARRTKAGIEQLKGSLAKRKTAMNKLVSQETALAGQLTQAELAAATGGVGITSGVTYTGPTSSPADKAVAFAYSKLGCPYVWGGTGPCADGYDCSGLTMEAWASGGVSIPRTAAEQWAGLPSVALPETKSGAYIWPEAYDSLEPGDILVFLDGAHVGLYVGNRELIEAPQTGEDVQLVSFSGWYIDNFNAAVRP